MKFKNLIIASAMLFTGVAHAQSSVTLYGLIDASSESRPANATTSPAQDAQTAGADSPASLSLPGARPPSIKDSPAAFDLPAALRQVRCQVSWLQAVNDCFRGTGIASRANREGRVSTRSGPLRRAVSSDDPRYW